MVSIALQGIKILFLWPRQYAGGLVHLPRGGAAKTALTSTAMAKYITCWIDCWVRECEQCVVYCPGLQSFELYR